MTAIERVSREAVLAAFRGKQVQCGADHYQAVRGHLVRAVQILVEDGNEEAAERVMVAVLRLDGIHRKEAKEAS